MAVSTQLNLNYVSETIQPGESANVQGGGFTGTCTVVLQAIDTSGSVIATQNFTAANWISWSYYVFQITVPIGWAPGMYGVYIIDDSANVSQTRYINQANGTRFSIDAVAPGGTVEVWGRNLFESGYSPSLIFVDGGGGRTSASITLSTLNHLKATVPGSLTVGGAYTVRVANGYGGSLGETLINVPLAIRAAGNDYLGLGVEWAADFGWIQPGSDNLAANYASIANVFNILNDSRLTLHAVGDGVTDDGPAFRAAQALAAAHSLGGGIVYTPTPSAFYLITSGVSSAGIRQPTNVIFAGDSCSATIIKFGTSGSGSVEPIHLFGSVGSSHCGFKDLNLVNLGTGLMVKTTGSSPWDHVFFQNVQMDCNTGQQAQIVAGSYLLMLDCIYNNISETSGAILLEHNNWMVLRNTRINYRRGRTAITYSPNPIVDNCYFQGDGNYRYVHLGVSPSTGKIEGSYTPGCVIQNTRFDTINFTAGTTQTADEEAVVKQNSDSTQGFVATGSSTSSTLNTLTDSAQSWPISFFPAKYGAAVPPGQFIFILDEIGAGQVRRVTGFTSDSVTVSPPWDFPPPASSTYVLGAISAYQDFLIDCLCTNNFDYLANIYFGAVSSTISGNTITTAVGMPQNNKPSGIYILSEGRDRPHTEHWSPDPSVTTPTRQVCPALFNQIFNNTLINYQSGVATKIQIEEILDDGTPGLPMMFVNEIRGNSITDAPIPNPKSGYFVTTFNANPGKVPPFTVPVIYGTIFENNTSVNVPAPVYNLSPFQVQTITDTTGGGIIGVVLALTNAVAWSPQGAQQQPGVDLFYDAYGLLPGQDNGVGYEVTGAVNGTASLTAIWDLWTAQAVDGANFLAAYEGVLTILLEESNDGVTWNTVTLSGSSASVSSSSFTVGAAQTFSISIPAGTYSTATWSATGTASGVSGSVTYNILSLPSTSQIPVGTHGNGAFSDGPTSASGAQLGDINAAAGGSMSANYNTTSSGVTETGVVVTLDLGGMAMNNGGVFLWQMFMEALSATSARFWRLSLTDTASGGATAQVGLRQFTLSDGGTTLMQTAHTGDVIASARDGGFTLTGNLFGLWEVGGSFSNAIGVDTTMPMSGTVLTWFTQTGEWGLQSLPSGAFNSTVTDCTGAFTVSAGGLIQSLSLFLGPMISAGYSDYAAAYGRFRTAPFPVAYAYPITTAGVNAYNGLVSSQGNYIGPGNANDFQYWMQDPAYPEYAAQVNPGIETLDYTNSLFQPVDINNVQLNHPEFEAVGGTSGQNVSFFGKSQYYSPPEGFGGYVDGAWDLDLVAFSAPDVLVYYRKDGVFIGLTGVQVTVGDSCGESETVTSQAFALPYSTPDNLLTTVNPRLINSVSVDMATVNYSNTCSGTQAAFLIYPDIDANISHAYIANQYGANYIYPGKGLLGVRLPDQTTPRQPQADTFNGILAVFWVDGSGAGLVAIHRSPLMHIGDGGGGWEANQNLYSSGLTQGGIVYLPTGRLFLACDAGANKQKFSDTFGAGGWTNVPTDALNYTENVMQGGVGRYAEEAFTFGGSALYRCRDRAGTEWIPANTTPFTGYGVSLRDGRYLVAAASGGSLSSSITETPAAGGWTTAGSATVTGTLIGLTYTSSGVLVGLLWDSGASNQFWGVRSYDQGRTWQQDSNLIPITQIPALTAAPCMTSIGHTVFVVWVADTQPTFACSLDSGRSWT